MTAQFVRARAHECTLRPVPNARMECRAMGAQARAQFKTRSTAKNVSIFVPVPPDADSPKFRTNSSGSVKVFF
jgi:5-formyltetrahydrofolate cyclo-ligase